MKNTLLLSTLLLFSFLSYTQTSEPPQLTCVRNNGADIEIAWNLPLSDCGGAFNSYDIYSSFSPTDPFSIETSITDPTATTVVINNPTGSIMYFYIVANRNCPPGTIVPTSDTLDNIKPQPGPRIRSVSVNSSNQVEVSWDANPSKEVVGYLVYNDNNGFNNPDTVWGRTNTFFLDVNANPLIKTHRYFIRTFEYCENDTGFIGSSLSDSARLEIHSSILIKYASQNKCDRTALVAWNKYDNYGYQGGVIGYVIWADVNGSGYQPVDTLPPTDSIFNIPNILAGDVYDIKVSALLPGNFEAFSNSVNFIGQTALVPVNFHVYNVKPLPDGTVEISYYNEKPDAVKSIQLQRSFDGVNFDNINAREETPPGAIIRRFKDGTAKPNERPAYYRFVMRDSCDAIYQSGEINTVFISGKEEKDGGIELFWNRFSVTDGAPTQYELVKYFNGVETDRIPLGTNTFGYFDADPFRPELLDTVCYQLEIPYSVAMGSTSADTITISNTICFTPEPKAYVPNAFKPFGIQPENRKIKPNLAYATDEGYLFQVFNRYGETMFSSEDRAEAWDGTYKGDPSLMDSYIYVVKFKGLDGTERSKTGVIMLLR